MIREFEKAYQAKEARYGASALRIGDPNLLIALDASVERGKLVGQLTFNDVRMSKDCFYYLNPEKDNPPLHITSEWVVPQFATPEERLKRPVVLNTGTTRTIEPTEAKLAEIRAELDTLTLLASKHNLYGRKS